MSTAGRDQSSTAAASDAARALAGADFVRLVARADGDSLAATGVLARALDARGTPFQATASRPFDEGARGTDADCTVAVGHAPPSADVAIAGAEPASATAFDAVRELGETPDPALALAGVTAADAVVGRVAEAADDAGLDRFPGVAVPVADLADGLAHTTLVHAPFSGDADAASEALSAVDVDGDAGLADRDADDGRRVASLVALAVAGATDATPRAAERLERGLRPYRGGPFATVGGYGDVLDAAARERPGVGVALALGHDGVREEVLAAWRDHAQRAHRAVADATVRRYDGLFVARGGPMPVGTVARLVADFRSPEPVTLVVGDDRAAVRSIDDRDVLAPLRAAVEAVDGEVTGTAERARARFDGDRYDFVETFREAL